MIVSVEQEIGMELHVLFAQLTQTGMERHVLDVMVEDFGIHLILFVNVQMKPNGTELLVLRPVLMVKFFKTVFVSVHKVNSNKMENVSTTQLVKQDINGMESNALPFHVSQVPHMPMHVDVVKPQFMLAQQVLIGMVIDVFTLQTSAQQV